MHILFDEFYYTMDVLSIKVEPEDTLSWEEEKYNRVVLGSYETASEVTGDRIKATAEVVHVSSGFVDVDGIKKEEASDPSQGTGSDDLLVQVTVQMEDEVLTDRAENKIPGIIKEEDEPANLHDEVPTTPTLLMQRSHRTVSPIFGTPAFFTLPRTLAVPLQQSPPTVSISGPSSALPSLPTAPALPLQQSQTRVSSISQPLRNLDKFSAAERSILMLIMEVKAEVKELKSHVKHLINLQQSETTENEIDMLEGLSLPCTDVDELFQLDEKVKINKAIHKQLLCILSTTGGRTVREVVSRMMRELMLNCVAVNFNWTGQGTKNSFRDLALRSIMEKAVRRNAATQTTSGHDIKVELCHYLKGASDRDGGRQARRKPPPEQPNA